MAEGGRQALRVRRPPPIRVQPSESAQPSCSLLSPRSLWHALPAIPTAARSGGDKPHARARGHAEDEEDDLCASAAVLRKLSRRSREEMRPSSSKFSFKELELSSKKLDAAQIKISQIDLSWLEGDGDELPLCSPHIRYNYCVERAPEVESASDSTSGVRLSDDPATPKEARSAQSFWLGAMGRSLSFTREQDCALRCRPKLFPGPASCTASSSLDHVSVFSETEASSPTSCLRGPAVFCERAPRTRSPDGGECPLQWQEQRRKAESWGGERAMVPSRRVLPSEVDARAKGRPRPVQLVDLIQKLKAKWERVLVGRSRGKRP